MCCVCVCVCVSECLCVWCTLCAVCAHVVFAVFDRMCLLPNLYVSVFSLHVLSNHYHTHTYLFVSSWHLALISVQFCERPFVSA